MSKREFGYLVGGLVVAGVLGALALYLGGSVQMKEGRSGMSLRVIGYQHITLVDTLKKAWKKDPTATRAELTAWGLKHKFVDGSSLSQLMGALQKWHPGNWLQVKQLADHMMYEEKQTQLNVTIAYSENIESGHLYFKAGDKRFFNYLQHDCEVAVSGNSSITELVYDGRIVRHKANVVVSFSDLVDLWYKARYGPQSVPDKSSKKYKKLAAWVRKMGTFRGKVYIL